MSDAAYERVLRAVERYGFGLVLAAAVLWFVRVDLVLPLVDAHSKFLDTMTQTQREIAQAVQEQTRLLYVIDPSLKYRRVADESEPEEGRN